MVSPPTDAAAGSRHLTAASGTGAPSAAPRSWSFRRVGPLWVLLAIAVVHSASRMHIGVDTWSSLASGRHVLAHGVPIADPFSFHSRPPRVPSPEDGFGRRAAIWLHPDGWINQAWITHAGFALVERAAGVGALVAAKYASYALVAVLLLLAARARGADPRIALILTGLALLAGRTFYEVRPQDVTNVLAAVLMLFLAAAPRMPPRFAWLAVPLFALWGNVHGGFVWGLVAFGVFLGATAIGRWRPGRLLTVPRPAQRLLAWAAACSLLAVVTLSPYRLTNLTHPLLVSTSADAAEWRNVLEWLPLSAGSTAEQALFAVCAVACALAAAAYLRDPARARRERDGRPALEAGADGTLAFDLGSAAIVALTLVMAVTSRRFLPMAYLVAAPLLAQWLTGAGARLAAAGALGSRFAAFTASARIRRTAALAAWTVAVACAVAYTVAYSRTFFGSWPLDDTRTSLADRALQTVGEPWDACRFVGLNQLQGRLWNSWEAGSFWVWCQSADPATGRTPLQVFFDGRAQVAYDIQARRLYDLFDAGGPVGLRLESEARDASPQEIEAITAWVAKSVPEEGIWLAHLTERRKESRLAIALFSLPQWQPVYQDEYHTLLADSSTPQGEALVAAVDAGRAQFPTDVSRTLTRAYRALVSGQGSGRHAFVLAREAYTLRPSPRAVVLATGAARDPAVANDVAAFCRGIVEDVIRRHDEIVRSHGGYQRLAAGVSAARHLQQVAQSAGDEPGRRQATEQLRWLAQEANALVTASEW